MSATSPTYRPHNTGHDYYAPGIYLITLVTRNRIPCFGQLNNDPHQPAVLLSEVGGAVIEEWQKIVPFEQERGRIVCLHGAVVMPDHFHGVIEVMAPMDKSLGQVIWGFKVACTKRWRALSAIDSTPSGATQPGPSGIDPSNADGRPRTVNHQVPPCQPSLAGTAPSSTAPSAPITSLPPDLHNMSRKQRAQYYAAHPEAQQPLFDDNYDDTICLTDPTTGQYDQRHLRAMVCYVADNPRRAIVRRLNPQFMEHRQHIQIAGRDYAAFGNLFLLRWARKVQVFCHRRSPDGRQQYIDTEAFRDDCRRWKAQVLAGATVLVTPGISPGELFIKNRCIAEGYPLIHIQKEPLPPFYKPEQSRFDACARGSLLILSPWHAEALGDFHGVPSQTDYSIFHNLNSLAAEICNTDAEMRWVSMGM